MSSSQFLSLLAIVGLILLFILPNVISATGSNDLQLQSQMDVARDVSGWRVADIAYTLNATNAANLDSVNLTLLGTSGAVTPSAVRVQLTPDGAWFQCANRSGSLWSCATSGVTVAMIQQLRVVAV